MQPKNKKKFEFKLGKTGVIFLIVGLSFMVCTAFIGGMIIGMDMENMPGLVSRDISSSIFSYFLPAKGPDSTANLTAANATANTTANATNGTTNATASINNTDAQKTTDELQMADLVKGKYIVQFALFKGEKSTKKMMERLQTADVEASCALIDKGSDGKFIAIFADGFKSEKVAQQHVKAVARKLSGIKPTVIPSKKYRIAKP